MQLHYREIGSGTPLVCLHGGMGLDHTIFLPWFEGLGAGVRVVLFDFSGNGRSGGDRLDPLTPHETWVADVEMLREHLRLERFALFGHSYGGLLAQEYALRHPQRVTRLVLSNTVPTVDYGPEILGNAQARGTAAQVQLAARVLTEGVRNDDEMRDAFRELLPLYFHRWDSESARSLVQDVEYRAAAFMAGNVHGMPGFDTRGALPDLEIPTLVLSGRDDWIMPVEHGGDRLVRLLPDARHVVLERSGHFPYVEESEDFARAVVDFVLAAEA